MKSSTNSFRMSSNITLGGTRGDRHLDDALEFVLPLSDVSRNADHARVEILAEPGNDDRSIKPAGVGEGDGLHVYSPNDGINFQKKCIIYQLRTVRQLMGEDEFSEDEKTRNR